MRVGERVKVTDYVARLLADRGLTDVFALTGGGAMHLNDSLGHEPRLTCRYLHHEQACAIAAEGYARVTGTPAVVNVTTGPGGINALNGVFGAWTDSIPMLVISGQVKRETLMATYRQDGLRQLGDQEADILAMASGITKYAALVEDPSDIRFHLEKALFLASAGRPGPCWIDVPMDVQGASVDPDALRGYESAPVAEDGDALAETCRDIVSRIEAAQRPVVMIGSGVRLAGALDVFMRVARKLGIPVTTAWTAIDALPADDPLWCGRPGTVGDRPGNFTVQNADLLLVIGSRLNIRQVSYNWASFARAALKIQVDADPAELRKPTVRPDLPVHCDARRFLEELERQVDVGRYEAARHAGWLAWCRERVARYPVVEARHRVQRQGRVNPYHFVDRLFALLAPDDVVVCGDGSACVVTFQAARTRAGQRVFTNSGCASMGYDLPAAIGAAVARGGERVICLAGDGSLQLNIQELQSVAHHRLPLKLFVLSNGGYLSIRLTQMGFFGRLAGEGPASGVTFPDIVKVAEAYGLPAVRIEGEAFEAAIRDALAAPGPVVCDVRLDEDQGFEPKSSSRRLADGRIVSAPLEDLAPFLPRDEFRSNMLIPPVAEQT